jgi:hypothetical protein
MPVKTTEREPSDDDWAAISGAAEAGSDLFPFSGGTPAVVQEQVQEYLNNVLSGDSENPLGENLAFALGALWANSICAEYGWEWIVPMNGDWRGLGVADPERRYLALPFNFFSTLLFSDEGRQMPGPLIRFRAIGGNNLPDSYPGAYVIITS